MFDRFEFDELERLASLLGLLDVVYTSSKYAAFDTTYAIFLLCARLAWPTRQKKPLLFSLVGHRAQHRNISVSH